MQTEARFGTPKNPMTFQAWTAEGERRFGKDKMAWKFKCPACGHVASVADWKAAKADEGAVAYSCVGRWMDRCKDAFDQGGSGPCTYAGGGLFQLNPVHVADSLGNVIALFEFA